ncbi:hypothetical protein [Streptomyces sp. cg36]|uniref:hypothetical protein n=1 Tax=Streptomyces sp. cg36 TaxID=3238798 RepID=UPI0034E2295E
MPAPPLAQPTPSGRTRGAAPAPSGAPPYAEGAGRGAAEGAQGVRAPGGGNGDCAGDVVRWAAFSCLLVPVVLVVYGASSAGATGLAIGLTAVTAVCRLLLRQSERAAAASAGRHLDGPVGRHGRRRRESSPLD